MEQIKPKTLLSKDDARMVAQAINGAIGSALAKLTGAQVGPEPAREAVTAKAAPLAPAPALPRSETPDDFERLYQRLKGRLLDDLRVDPIFVKLLAAQPEILVEIEPRRVALDASSLRGRVALLVANGFLESAKSQAEINRELARTGAQAHSGRLSETVNGLKIDGILTQEDSGYRRAPGVVVTKGQRELATA